MLKMEKTNPHFETSNFRDKTNLDGIKQQEDYSFKQKKNDVKFKSGRGRNPQSYQRKFNYSEESSNTQDVGTKSGNSMNEAKKAEEEKIYCDKDTMDEQRNDQKNEHRNYQRNEQRSLQKNEKRSDHRNEQRNDFRNEHKFGQRSEQRNEQKDEYRIDSRK